MVHIHQYVIGYKEKDRRSLLKYIGLVSLMFIWIVLLMTYTLSFFDFISKQRASFEEGYLVQSEAQHIQANNGVLEQRREKALTRPSEIKDGMSIEEKNVLSSYVLFGKALRGFQRDAGNKEVKNRQH